MFLPVDLVDHYYFQSIQFHFVFKWSIFQHLSEMVVQISCYEVVMIEDCYRNDQLILEGIGGEDRIGGCFC